MDQKRWKRRREPFEEELRAEEEKKRYEEKAKIRLEAEIAREK